MGTGQYLPVHTRFHSTIVSTTLSTSMRLGLDLRIEKKSNFIWTTQPINCIIGPNKKSDYPYNPTKQK